MRWITLTLLGCAGYDLNDGGFSDRASLESALPEGTLRIDIHPSADGNNLLPQSFLAGPEAYGDGQLLNHPLEATIVFDGTFSAEVVQGWQNAGSAGNFQGVVRAERTGFIQSSAAHTDEEGGFTLTIPGGQSYSVAVVPDSAGSSPVTYLGDVEMNDGREISELIAAAAPVYGRVTDNAGNPVAGVSLLLRDVETGLASSPFTTDATGWYIARAQSDRTYTLESIGEDIVGGPIVPSVAVEFEVLDEAGVQVDLGVGELASFDLKAEIVRESGEGLGDATVRLTSVGLDGSAGSLELETTNQGNGGFSLSALPGRYRVEIWPGSSNRELAPVVFPSVRLGSDVDLGQVVLAAPVRLNGQIDNEEAVLLRDAIVIASQLDGGEYSFSTTTDGDGRYSLDLPAGQYEVQIVPADADSGALSSQVVAVDSGSELSVSLTAGTTVEGVATFGDTVAAFALVEIYNPNTDALLAQVLTDAEGRYSARVALDDTTDDAAGDTAEE